MNKVHINKLPDLGARLPDDCEDQEEMEQLKMEVYGKDEIAAHIIDCRYNKDNQRSRGARDS